MRRRLAPEMLVVCMLALRIASICFGLYGLIQAFDVFDLPTPLGIWFSRAPVTMAVGVIALHIGGKRAGALQGTFVGRSAATFGRSTLSANIVTNPRDSGLLQRVPKVFCRALRSRPALFDKRGIFLADCFSQCWRSSAR